MQKISEKTAMKGKKSMTAKELIQKHIKDPNHKITDEDLNNVKVGITIEDETEISIHAKEMEEDFKGHHGEVPNPYDVLGNE